MRKVALLTVLVFCGLYAAAWAGSAAAPNIKGWERGSEYDQLYDPKEGDTLKGRVVKIMEVVPIDGMAPGVGFQIEDKKDKSIEFVHLGPKDFVDIAAIGLKVGDDVKVVGVWGDLDAQDILMAVKVKKGENVELKVRRTKDGFPYWSMTAEERRKEQSGN